MMNKTVTDLQTVKPFDSVQYGALVWKKLKNHKLAILAMIILFCIVSITIIGPLFFQTNFDDMDFEHLFSPPFRSNHVMGTDEVGHDVFIRILYGGRISLLVGFVSALLTSFLGTALGLVSGFFGGVIDRICMRLVDIFLSLPLFPILLIATLLFGSGLFNIIMVLVLFGWMQTARLVRGQTLTLRETEYVAAAKVLGVKNLLIMYKYIFPNVLPIIIVATTLNISYAILVESTLSYLGLGIQPPMPSWGNMLQGSMNYILGTNNGSSAWWLTFFPGFFIFITVLHINFLGDGLRDALDPQFVSESGNKKS